MARKPTCPLCARRGAGRECPALGNRICATCCGTKRQVEIDCPADCSYLRTAQAHPPAVVQRQQERDVLFAIPMVQGLTDRQQHLLVLIQGVLRADRPDAAGLTDDDVARAARALADTYETASRGIIYEHAAATAAAERLGAHIKALIEHARGEGAAISDVDAAAALRRIERAAGDAGKALPGGETACLDWLKRTFRDPGPAEQPAAEGLGSAEPGGAGLIIPGR